jgi:hypothetical protein
MQILLALVALPAVALLLAVASRLEDGLRAVAPARPPQDFEAMALRDAEREPSAASPVG